jgi:hypothetical protein
MQNLIISVAVIFCSYFFGFIMAKNIFTERQQISVNQMPECVAQEFADTQKIKDIQQQLEACINDLAALSYEQNADIVCMDEYVCKLKRKDQ